MGSIRSRLTFWLLGGSIALWLAAGTVIYLSVRHSLLKSLDAELALDARIVRFAARGEGPEMRGSPARGLRDRMPDYNRPDGNSVFQVWDSSGRSTEKSVSLGEFELGFPAGDPGKEPRFEMMRLEDGREFRTMVFRIVVGGKGKGRGPGPGRRGPGADLIAIGKDTAQLQETMASVLWGILMVGAGVAAGVALLVRLVVALVLKPLRALGHETQAVDAHRLNARFDDGGAPAELVPIYAQLNDLISRLETSFDRERRFNSDLAHEMRTPLAELKMLNEVALKWEDQAGEVTHQQTLEIVAQLESIIETLLALARFESGDFAPDLRPVELDPLLDEAWARYAEAADKKRLRIGRQFPDAAASIRADRELLLRIVSNLVSNAVEYSPDGSQLEMACGGGWFKVTNPAPGLAASDCEHLFDRYWRRESARSDSNHVGLGLSLARACADACGLGIRASLSEGALTIEVREDRPGAPLGELADAEEDRATP